MATIGSLVIDIGMNVGRLTRDAAHVTQQLDTMQSKFDAVGGAIKGLAGAYIGLQAAQEVVNATIIKGLKAVDDFKTDVASLSAVVMTFMDKSGKGNLGAMWKEANDYAKGMVPVLEQIAAKTLLSGSQTTKLATEFAKAGVFLDANNSKAVEGFTNISNALAVMTKGQDAERQITTEIRSLMTGKIDATSTLARMLQAIDPQLKEHLKTWQAEGVVMERIGELLMGFGPATKELEGVWEAVKTTIDTTVTQVLRGGMMSAYDELMGLVKQLNEWLVEHREILTNGIHKAWVAISGAVEGIMTLISPLVPSLKELAGWIGKSAEGIGLIMTILPAIASSFNALVESTGAMAKNIMWAATAALQFAMGDLQGAMNSASMAQAEWQRAGELAGKAFGDNFTKEIDQRISRYYQGSKNVSNEIFETQLSQLSGGIISPAIGQVEKLRETLGGTQITAQQAVKAIQEGFITVKGTAHNQILSLRVDLETFNKWLESGGVKKPPKAMKLGADSDAAKKEWDKSVKDLKKHFTQPMIQAMDDFYTVSDEQLILFKTEEYERHRKANEEILKLQKTFGDQYLEITGTDMQKALAKNQDRLQNFINTVDKLYEKGIISYQEMSDYLESAATSINYDDAIVEANNRIQQSAEDTGNAFQKMFQDISDGAGNILSIIGVQMPNLITKFNQMMSIGSGQPRGINGALSDGPFAQLGMGMKGLGMLGMGDPSQMIANLASWGVISPDTAYNWMQPGGFGGTLGTVGSIVGSAGMGYGLGSMLNPKAPRAGTYGAIGSTIGSVLGGPIGGLIGSLASLFAGKADLPEFSMWSGSLNNEAFGPGKQGYGQHGDWTGYQAGEVGFGMQELGMSEQEMGRVAKAFQKMSESMKSAMTDMGMDVTKFGEHWQQVFGNIENMSPEQIQQKIKQYMSDYASFVSQGAFDQWQKDGEEIIDTVNRIFVAFKSLPDAAKSFDYATAQIKGDMNGAMVFQDQISAGWAELQNIKTAMANTTDPAELLDLANQARTGIVNLFGTAKQYIDGLTNSIDQLGKQIEQMDSAMIDIQMGAARFSLNMQQKIDTLKGTFGTRGNVEAFAPEWKNLYDRAGSPQKKLDILGAGGEFIDAWLQSGISEIQAKYAALQQKANESAQKAAAAHQAAIQAQLDGLNKQMEVINGWKSLLSDIQDTIASMSISSANPDSARSRAYIAQQQAVQLMGLMGGASGQQRLEYATRAKESLQAYLGVAGEAYQRPSVEYGAAYQWVMDQLQKLQGEAAGQSENAETILARIESLQSSGNSYQATAVDYTAAMNDEIQALKDSAAGYYAWAQSEGATQYEAILAEQETQRAALVSQQATAQAQLDAITNNLGAEGWLAQAQTAALTELSGIRNALEAGFKAAFPDINIPEAKNYSFSPSKSGGGNTIYIDARGATDPAGTAAAVTRVFNQALKYDPETRDIVARIR